MFFFTSKGEYDIEFIQVLETCCLEFIVSKQLASIDDIHNQIKVKNVTRVKLTTENVSFVLQRLIYSGLIQKTNENYYAPTYNSLSPPAFTSTPCGTCPVFSQCKVGGSVISPTSCIYLNKWLDLGEFDKITK